MKPTVIAAERPINFRLAAFASTAHFCDSWQILLPQGEEDTALGYFLQILQKSPVWVDRLMLLRNRVVQLVGLKDLSVLSAIDPAKPALAYLPGERVGIFTLIEQSPEEVIVGDKDKHLEVRLSVLKETIRGQRYLTVTTAVYEHNRLGKLYMVFVKPFHRRIAPATLRRLYA